MPTAFQPVQNCPLRNDFCLDLSSYIHCGLVCLVVLVGSLHPTDIVERNRLNLGLWAVSPRKVLYL